MGAPGSRLPDSHGTPLSRSRSLRAPVRDCAKLRELMLVSRSSSALFRLVRRTLGLAFVLALSSCAHRPNTGHGHGVPIDARPTPRASVDTTATKRTHAPAPSASRAPRTPPPLRARVVGDTLVARAAIERCRGRMNPEREGIVGGTEDLLARARAAMIAGHLESAESFARKARQLASSLDCR